MVRSILCASEQTCLGVDALR